MRRVIAFAKLSSFAALIRPYTTRLEIAGSVRRKQIKYKWGNPADHLIAPDEMVSQPALFTFAEMIRHEEARLTDDAPTTPKRIHPVTVTRWTPELTARYADQVRLESIDQFESQAATLRKRAGGDRQSHYWLAADRAQATASALRGVQP